MYPLGTNLLETTSSTGQFLRNSTFGLMVIQGHVQCMTCLDGRMTAVLYMFAITLFNARIASQSLAKICMIFCKET